VIIGTPMPERVPNLLRITLWKGERRINEDASYKTVGWIAKCSSRLWEVIVVLRVCKAEEASRIVVTLDGRLLCDYVEVVETCCDQAVSTGKPVHVFLRDVSAVDPAGLAMLCRLASKGIHLLASGVYTSHLIRAINPTGKEQSNSSTAAGPSSG
jgi:hypothetical protein